MRKLVATRKGYVRRLRQMLDKWYSKGTYGGGCPIRAGLKFRIHCNRAKTGMWCRDFIGFDKYSYLCPCNLTDNAPALALWDAGKHKWQKE